MASLFNWLDCWQGWLHVAPGLPLCSLLYLYGNKEGREYPTFLFSNDIPLVHTLGDLWYEVQFEVIPAHLFSVTWHNKNMSHIKMLHCPNGFLNYFDLHWGSKYWTFPIFKCSNIIVRYSRPSLLPWQAKLHAGNPIKMPNNPIIICLHVIWL